ncbi:hypothetical protein T4C_11225 [Trichinella pseudospiralis]|uniref:Uncharacterized protein n=1 Tax=Trichinella pseudospiralis TaxID=6337 RepID=A0A0V1IPX1_TRIPS|nr:hypothetical protein T4C_11225 [Trichinella pseudospiralis]
MLEAGHHPYELSFQLTDFPMYRLGNVEIAALSPRFQIVA